uniref:NADH dehydrogenase subunit 6 n=1 Tax=Chaetocnema confinis TaxID=1896592 RepID=UPI0022376755|nr:NADH dehydrogenase subunit 6 [Chaetocnema confinis]UYC28917.1 NADH dehydrogenase subunit 6 [Chaetocnema confinis]
MMNLILVNSLMLIFLKHPLSSGLTLMLQTIMISIMTGKMSMNFWFSYILFIIMIGGMMVLFIYMTSIASNEKFKINPLMFIILLITLIMTFFTEFPIIETMNFSTYQFKFMFKKYLDYPHLMITLFMMTYLFICLILVIKMTNNKQGALRQKF